MPAAERQGALLCSEGLALLQAFRGRANAARAAFHAAADAWPPTGRLLREWALFEKRHQRLDVSLDIVSQPYTGRHLSG